MNKTEKIKIINGILKSIERRGDHETFICIEYAELVNCFLLQSLENMKMQFPELYSMIMRVGRSIKPDFDFDDPWSGDTMDCENIEYFNKLRVTELTKLKISLSL